jgi:hypothetical protein
MTIALILAVFIPLGFWAFDIVVKVLGSIPTDDTGADLCLFGISFNVTTLLQTITSHIARPSEEIGPSIPPYVALSSAALVASLILYVFCLILIAPQSRQYPPIIQKLRRNPRKALYITVVLGFLTVATEVALYIMCYN